MSGSRKCIEAFKMDAVRIFQKKPEKKKIVKKKQIFLAENILIMIRDDSSCLKISYEFSHLHLAKEQIFLFLKKIMKEQNFAFDALIFSFCGTSQ